MERFSAEYRLSKCFTEILLATVAGFAGQSCDRSLFVLERKCVLLSEAFAFKTAFVSVRITINDYSFGKKNQQSVS
jgi:hypothetical protein